MKFKETIPMSDQAAIAIDQNSNITTINTANYAYNRTAESDEIDHNLIGQSINPNYVRCRANAISKKNSQYPFKIAPYFSPKFKLIQTLQIP